MNIATLAQRTIDKNLKPTSDGRAFLSAAYFLAHGQLSADYVQPIQEAVDAIAERALKTATLRADQNHEALQKLLSAAIIKAAGNMPDGGSLHRLPSDAVIQ